MEIVSIAQATRCLGDIGVLHPFPDARDSFFSPPKAEHTVHVETPPGRPLRAARGGQKRRDARVTRAGFKPGLR